MISTDRPGNRVARPRSERSGAYDTVIVGVVAALTGGLGALNLSGSSLWLDEVYTVAVASSPTADFITDLMHNGGNMSLYLVFMRLWLTIGGSEAWIRFPSVIFAAASVPTFFSLARRLVPRQTALTAVVLFAVSAPLIQYSREGRSYTLLVLLVIGAWLTLVRHVEDGAPRRWFVLLAALSVYAHIIAVVFIGAQLLWLAVSRSPRRATEAGLLILVIAQPQLFVALGPRATSPGWIPPLSVDVVIGSIRFLVGAPSGWTAVLVLAAWSTGGAVALRRSIRGSRAALVPLLWLSVPVAAVVGVSFAEPFLVPRYLLPALPAGALLAAIALARLGSFRLFAVAALLALSSPAVHAALTEEHPDFRSASGLIFEQSRAQDGIIFVGGARHIAEYYWVQSGRPSAPRPLWEPHEWNKPRRLYPATDLEVVRARSQDLARIWVLVRHPSNGVSPEVWESVRELTEPRQLMEEWRDGGAHVLLFE